MSSSRGQPRYPSIHLQAASNCALVLALACLQSMSEHLSKRRSAHGGSTSTTEARDQGWRAKGGETMRNDRT